MKKDPKVFIGHISISIDKIFKFVDGLSEVDFSRDDKTQSAVLRELGVIGEAAKNLSVEFRNQYPEVEWRKVTGIRDKLVHEYFRVDMGIVWQTTQNDLPPLKEHITKILDNLN